MKTILQLKSLEKKQDYSNNALKDDSFPRYEFFSDLFKFFCVHTVAQFWIHLYKNLSK